MERKDLHEVLKDSFWKLKDHFQKYRRFFGSEMRRNLSDKNSSRFDKRLIVLCCKENHS